MLSFVVAISESGSATVFYVAPMGDDSFDGSEATPFKSIQRAADILNPGDTVIVKDGVYTTNDPWTIVDLRRGGTADNWVTFKSENKWGAVLNGQNNITPFGWFFDIGVNYVRVEGFELKGFKKGAFWSDSQGHHLYFVGNHIHDIGRYQTNSEYGICGVYQGPGTSYHTYDSNVLHHIGRLPSGGLYDYNHDHGLYLCGHHNTIINNLFYKHEAGWPIQITGTGAIGDGNCWLINNNTFAFPNPARDGHIVIWERAKANQITDVLIENNISICPRNNYVFIFVCSVPKNGLQNVTIRNNFTTASTIVTGYSGNLVITGNLTSISKGLLEEKGFQ